VLEHFAVFYGPERVTEAVTAVIAEAVAAGTKTNSGKVFQWLRTHHGLMRNYFDDAASRMAIASSSSAVS
jgi:hypothetical protein